MTCASVILSAMLTDRNLDTGPRLDPREHDYPWDKGACQNPGRFGRLGRAPANALLFRQVADLDQ